MLFTEYGKSGAPAVLLMHGMLQDWHSMYDLLGELEDDYRLIIPAMDGMYDGGRIFTSFADQCRQIEKYVTENHGGKLLGVYGISQGATLMAELLARNNINVTYAVLDGAYAAHQGEKSAAAVISAFTKAQKNGGKFPKTMMVMMKLMGLSEDDYKMFDCMYWDVDAESMRRNIRENYTYHLDPNIARSKTEIILWRGEKEPYAKKTNAMIKAMNHGSREIIFKGLGHGQLLYNNSKSVCRRLRLIFEKGISAYIDSTEKNSDILAFTDLSKYDYICEGLSEIYDKGTMEKIIPAAQRSFSECRRLTENATAGEKKHLNDTILLAAAFYKTLLIYDRENALENIRSVMMKMCAELGKMLDGILHVPGSQALFMKLIPGVVKKSFGRECGFDYKNFKASPDRVSLDMVKCPYCKFAEILGCPELTPVFCDCDDATYGSLNGIRFKRTQTLGKGGEKCDFAFIRK